MSDYLPPQPTLDPEKVASAFANRAAERKAGLSDDRAAHWLAKVDATHGSDQRDDDEAAAALNTKPPRKKRAGKRKKQKPLAKATRRNAKEAPTSAPPSILVAGLVAPRSAPKLGVLPGGRTTLLHSFYARPRTES